MATHFEGTAIHFFNIFLVLAEARPCFVRRALKSAIRANKLSDEGRFILGIRLGAEDLDFNTNRVIICITVSHNRAKRYVLAKSSQNAAREVCNGAELKSLAESVMNWILLRRSKGRLFSKNITYTFSHTHRLAMSAYKTSPREGP